MWHGANKKKATLKMGVEVPPISQGDHHSMISDFKRRFIISVLTSIPVLILSQSIQLFFRYSLDFVGRDYVVLGLSSLIFFYGGWPFLKGLIDELRGKNPGMMTLIAIAISVAYAYSTAVVLGLRGDPFFWELVTLIDIMLLGHWIEMKSVLGASRALEKLVELLPKEAHLIESQGEIHDIPLSKVQINDKILIKPGEKIPSDGIVINGESEVDESMLTGESRLVKKEIGNKVIGGAINSDGSLEIKVEHTGTDSYLTKVITLVREAQASKSRTQQLADKMAKYLTLFALLVGTITLIVWLIIGDDVQFAIERMATVMVICCPHALGLAVPLVVAISTTISAKNGLLIRNRTAFENARKITTILFDKTGTLTEGIFSVEKIYVIHPQYSSEQVLQFCASVEQNSEHPIAKAIVKKMQDSHVSPKPVSDFHAIKGKGVEGIIEGIKVQVLSPNSLRELSILIPDIQFNITGTVVFILVNSTQLIGAISLIDQIRNDSFEAIKNLKSVGIKCWMLTGDNENTARYVSDQLGLDGFYAEILPHQKLEKVQALQERGEFVAMTGDGVNDAPALAQSDVGIAVGSGTEIAAETADIILVNSNPRDIASLILFGRQTYSKMVQNLLWATGYNVITIPLAAGILYNYEILLSPAIGAILMSLSTIIVAINANLLKLKRKSTK